MSGDNGSWKVSQARFQGYTKAMLENIHDSLKEVNNKNEDQEKRINKVENRLTRTEVKGGIFGTIGGVVGGFISGFLK